MCISPFDSGYIYLHATDALHPSVDRRTEHDIAEKLQNGAKPMSLVSVQKSSSILSEDSTSEDSNWAFNIKYSTFPKLRNALELPDESMSFSESALDGSISDVIITSTPRWNSIFLVFFMLPMTIALVINWLPHLFLKSIYEDYDEV